MPELAPTPPRLARINLAERERDAGLAAGRVLLESTARKARVLGVYKARRDAPEAARLKVLDRLRVDAQKEARRITQRLLSGNLSRDQWQKQMRAALVPAHYAAALAASGSTRLDDAAVKAVQSTLRTQLGYLARFRNDLAVGKTQPDGRALTRADLYGAAIWSTGQEVAREQARTQGQREERSILGALDNCESCLDRVSQGWQPIGSLLPIGAGICRSRCKCRLEYRKVAESESVPVPLQVPVAEPPKVRPRTVAAKSAKKTAPRVTGIGGLADGTIFARPHGAEDGRRYKVVLADVAKVDASLKKDENFYVGPNGTGAAIGGRYAEASDFLRKAQSGGIPVHVSRLGIDSRGEAFIGDGRHRFAVLRDSGTEAVPVVVPIGDAAKFADRFGYRGGSTVVDAPAPAVPSPPPPAPKPPWRPTMSRKDAERFVSDSVYKLESEHVSGKSGAAGITKYGFDLDQAKNASVYGHGFYLAIDQPTGDFYRYVVGKDRAVTLKTVADVRNPYIYEGRSIDPKDILGKLPGAHAEFLSAKDRLDRDIVSNAHGRALTEVLKGRGYDSVVIRDRPGRPDPTVGGEQLLVFDPERVVVIREGD